MLSAMLLPSVSSRQEVGVSAAYLGFTVMHGWSRKRRILVLLFMPWKLRRSFIVKPF